MKSELGIKISDEEVNTELKNRGLLNSFGYNLKND